MEDQFQILSDSTLPLVWVLIHKLLLKTGARQWLKCVSSSYLLLHRGFSGVKGLVEKHVACGPCGCVPSHIHGGGALFVDVHAPHSTERHYRGEQVFSLFLLFISGPDSLHLSGLKLMERWEGGMRCHEGQWLDEDDHGYSCDGNDWQTNVNVYTAKYCYFLSCFLRNIYSLSTNVFT